MNGPSPAAPATFILDIGARVPWQVSVIAAVTFFVTLHFTANVDALPSTTTGPLLFADILRFMATILQYIVPALLLIGALASAVIRKRAPAVGSGGSEAIRNLTWWQFEKFLNAHFAKAGFTVQRTGKAARDGGVNLKLRRGTDKYFVQCKHWRARQVDLAAVRVLYRMMGRAGAAGGIVLTAGTFNRATHKFADSRKIELIDGAMLEALMRADHPSPGAMTKSAAAPQCPSCGSPMLVRVTRKGSNAGTAFWGCPRFPECKGTVAA